MCFRTIVDTSDGSMWPLSAQSDSVSDRQLVETSQKSKFSQKTDAGVIDWMGLTPTLRAQMCVRTRIYCTLLYVEYSTVF